MPNFDKLMSDIPRVVFTWREYKSYVFPVVYSYFEKLERQASIWNAWNLFGKGDPGTFCKELMDVVAKFSDTAIIDQSNLNKIDNVVNKFSVDFDDEQKKLMDAIKNGMKSRAEAMKENFNKDLSKAAARTLIIFLTDYKPHAHLSNKIKDFCEKCEQELDKYFEGDAKKQLQSGDPRNMEDVKKRINDGKNAYQAAIEEIKKVIKPAQKA